MIFPNSAF